MAVESPFLTEAFAVLPRALGLCDRADDSPSYGCCDRTYWNYRTVDFCNARYQEAGRLFALAARVAPGTHVLAGHARMADWSRAAWRFWLRSRNGDGSTAELYPRERCFCSTAFTAASFVQTVRLLGGSPEWSEELESAYPTLLWLGHSRNAEVANQMAASLLALSGFAALTGDGRIANLARRRRDEILAVGRDGNGFGEYGGLDIGYLSITLGLLARAMAVVGGDAALEDAIRKSARTLEDGIGENGRVDPTRNSRNTQFVYPYVLAVLGSPILRRLKDGLNNGTLLRPSWMDDRFFIPMAIDYFDTALEKPEC